MLDVPIHADAWLLDPAVTFLNHGSFGACPLDVLERQQELRAAMEREPVDFLVRRMTPLLDESRDALAGLIGADPADVVFVQNATAGVNAVLRSLAFRPGDEILVTAHDYNACRNVARYVAGRTGAVVVEAELPLPIDSPQQVVDAVLGPDHSPHAAGPAGSHHQPDGLDLPDRGTGAGAGPPGDRHAGGRRPRPRHGAARHEAAGGGLLHGQLPQVALRPEGGRLPLRPPRPAGGHPAADHQPRLEPPSARLFAVSRRLRLAGHARPLGLALRRRGDPLRQHADARRAAGPDRSGTTSWPCSAGGFSASGLGSCRSARRRCSARWRR